jgi:hypothetical protein
MKKIIRLTESDLTRIVKKILIGGNKSINESVDNIVNEIKPPYFRNLGKMRIGPNRYNEIFSKILNQPVRIENYDNGDYMIFNSNGKYIYQEFYVDGYWEKLKYDDNGNQIYYEDSKGTWWKKEYDENGKLVYHEKSDGHYYKKTSKNNNIQKSEDRVLEKIIRILEPPYFHNLDSMGITDDELIIEILSKIFNQPITLFDTKNIIGPSKGIINKKGKILYTEDTEIFFDDDDIEWYKYEYDEKGNQISQEDNYGTLLKTEYDEKGNIISLEDNYGYWDKREYDSNGNLIYHETSDEGIILDKRRE